MKTKSVAKLTLDDCLRLAEYHGLTSEPDHEVGDLQGLCRAMREVMSDAQWRRALDHREFVENILESAMGYDDIENTVEVPSRRDLEAERSTDWDC